MIDNINMSEFEGFSEEEKEAVEPVCVGIRGGL